MLESRPTLPRCQQFVTVLHVDKNKCDRRSVSGWGQARMRKVEHQASHTIHRYSLTSWAATNLERSIWGNYATELPFKLGSNVQSDFGSKE